MKRKKIFKILLGTVIALTLNATTILANNVRVFVDNAFLPINGVIVSDRTLIPLRVVGDAVGATVDWNGETRQVTLTHEKNVTILTIDSKEANINGETVELDVPAQIINDSTFLPLRFIADTLGFETDWISEEMLVVLRSSANPLSLSEIKSQISKDAKEEVTKTPTTQSQAMPQFTSYQQILDYFTGRLNQAAPVIAQELRTNAASNTGGLDGLVDLYLDHVEKLAAISVEGTEEMAALMFRTNGSMDVYMEYALLLSEVYLDAATLISDVYTELALSL